MTKIVIRLLTILLMLPSTPEAKMSIESNSKKLIKCIGSLKNRVNYKLIIDEQGLATLKLSYFKKDYTCLLKARSIVDKSDELGTTKYLIQMKRLAKCSPQLTAELHRGLKTSIDLRIKKSDKKSAELTLFEGYRAVLCKSALRNEKYIKSLKEKAYDRQLIKADKHNNSKPIPRLKSLFN